MEVKNSSGYFKDPATFEDLSSDMPREVVCSVTEEGKFIWPQVRVSDGSLVKIVYKYFTDEEKQLYKEYRSHDGKRTVTRTKKQKSFNLSTTSKADEPVNNPTDEPTDEIIYDTDAATSARALALIASCDRIIGCVQVAGLTYALLQCNGSNKTYYVPRALINNDEMYRLCGNEPVECCC